MVRSPDSGALSGQPAVEFSSTSYKLCDPVQVTTTLSLSFPSVKLGIVKSINLIQSL